MSDEKLISIVCPHCQTEYRVPPSIAGKKVACKRCEKTFTVSTTDEHPNLGLLAVKYNLITKAQLTEVLTALSHGASEKTPADLASALLERKLLTESQLETLKRTELLEKVSETSWEFGALALQKSMLTKADLKAAFEKQALLFKEAKTVRHIKDILLEEGRLGQSDHDLILDELNGAPSQEDEPATDAKTSTYELTISEDRMSVSLRATGTPPGVISPETVRRQLETEGVTHGIVDDGELEALLAALKKPDAHVVIARGTPPRESKDASLRYHFAKDQKVGTLGIHGEIDFKDRGEVPYVHPGDLLVEKTAGVPGTPGHDVFGNELTPSPPKDVKLLSGSGVETSEDRSKLFAKVEGQPKLTLGGRLSVVSDLVINGDVDLKTGHIDFEGNVKVNGTIQSGFNVKGANVEAREIIGAKITASGDVTTTGGIIGAEVKTQGNIRAKYIKQATLSTFGDIVVQKEITDSSINTSGACLLERGKILSSEISAKQGIEAVDIGTELSAPCKLSVGVDDHIEAEVEGIQNAIERRRDRISKMEEQTAILETEEQKTHKDIADQAQIQDRSLVNQRSLKEKLAELPDDDTESRPKMEAAIADLGRQAQEAEAALGGLFDRQDEITLQAERVQHETEQVNEDIYELEHELDAIRHWAKSQKKAAAIKISGTVFQGTFIGGPHTQTVIKEDARHVTIREVKNTDPDSSVEYEIKLQHS
jgi:predicted Zn finger-like uncharacterized protein